MISLGRCKYTTGMVKYVRLKAEVPAGWVPPGGGGESGENNGKSRGDSVDCNVNSYSYLLFWKKNGLSGYSCKMFFDFDT